MICFVLCFFVVHFGCVMTDTHKVLLCTRMAFTRYTCAKPCRFCYIKDMQCYKLQLRSWQRAHTCAVRSNATYALHTQAWSPSSSRDRASEFILNVCYS